MPNKQVYLLFLLLILGSGFLKAQILNDSIRQIYGPNTTLFITEESIKYNKEQYHNIDTLLNGLHNFTYVDRFGRKFQDLGNPGTAMRPVFYAPPDIIGKTSGFHSFDMYFTPPEQVRYYDTKSPYSKLFFVIGGNSRSVVDIDYSRNVNPRWNVGGSLTRISADKQLGPVARRGDRNTELTSYQIFTRYFSKDNKYQILANFSRLGANVNESGGIRANGNEPLSDLFEYEQAEIWLRTAQTRDIRSNIHAYHQYKISDLMQVYHSFDLSQQDVSFTNLGISGADGAYFNNIIFNSDSTEDQSSFNFLKNEIGIKGDINTIFYNFYLKRRDLSYDNKYLPYVARRDENYGGFNIRNDFNDEMNFYAFGEYLMGRNYKLGGGINFKYLEGNVKRIRYDPTFLQNAYLGNHYNWHRYDFTPTLSDNLFGAINLELPFLKFSPHINFHRINNHIYFGRDTIPVQASGAARIFSPGINMSLRFFRHMHLENNFIYTDISGNAADVFRIPQLFLNSRLYYENLLFKRKLQLQVGIDSHIRSAYKAYAYEPVIQQFFLQDQFTIPQYYLADVFLNAKIGRARIFVKYTNITETIGLMEGYFTTPYYTGQRGTLDFGVNWLFFD
ncbi:hypothetical protein BH23BAC1_BH23BAC1_47270 [soil metagenome]